MVDAFSRLFGKGFRKNTSSSNSNDELSSSIKRSDPLPDVETSSSDENGFTLIGDAPANVVPPPSAVRRVEPIIPSDAPHMLEGVPFAISPAWSLKGKDAEDQNLDRILAEVESLSWNALDYNFSIEKSVLEAN
eukprot:TRINITY_DN3614_c0_g1_i1.p1 TRINITY_DN3614_c0_g1~~TRINITY_DN3614_c0_g1_i1.p1  ORF type:complete len:134 (+),score=51.95 TRINITY_DN3614_c0_g1_i1:69-470(+)